MMGKTHISVGVAAAVVLTQPSSLGGCIAAIIGGSTGGLICDIEVRSNRYHRDALHARIILAALVVVALLADALMRGPVTSYVLQSNVTLLLAGAVLLAGASIFGRFQPHRTFTHSLLGLVLFSIGVALLCLPLTFAFAVGFLSHVLLDLLNKKPIQLLYPSKAGKVCLGVCYANGKANQVFLVLGVLGSAVGLGYAILHMS